MEIEKIIRHAHTLIEAKEIRRISQKEMAEKLGISLPTYASYLQGKYEQIGMKTLLKMLNYLNDDEIVKVVRMWKQKTEKEQNNDIM